MSHRSPLFFHLLFVALLSLISSPSAHATPGAAQVSLQVLRSGVPAPDVPYTIRQFDYKTGMAKPPRRLRTDAKGRIDIEVILPPPRGFFGAVSAPRNPDYLLIDDKDASLTIVSLDMFRYPTANTIKQVELVENGTNITGTVVQGAPDATGTPIVGADVTLTSAHGFLLNDAHYGVKTPQMIGKTVEGGTVKLRPLSFYLDTNASGGCSLVVTHKAGGQLLKNHVAVATLRRIDRVRPSLSTRYYRLAPTISIGGQVVESGSNRPIEGALVELKSKSLAERMFASTDKKGKWRIEGIPPQGSQVFAVATHPKHGLSWTAVQTPVSGINGWEVEATGVPETTLAMVGMTKLTGRIIDETTGKTPTLVHPEWPVRPQIFSTYSSGDSKVRSENNLPDGITEAEIHSDGSFSLQVPMGRIYLKTAIPFFSEFDNQNRTLVVTDKGVDNVLIRVKKFPHSMIVKFVAEDPKDLKDIQVLDIRFKPEGVPRGGDATSPYYMWGGSVTKAGEEQKMRIRYGTGKTFETTFVHSLDNWPQIVVLPAKPPVIVAPPLTQP